MAASSQNYQHPLPPPPQQAGAPLQYSQPSQQQSYSQARPRTFSAQSSNSRRSFGGNQDLTESPADKKYKRISTKADPTIAMNEAEPAAVAAMASESSHAPLRSFQHRDSQGLLIADPDKSNPTRNRWERPLDTIRSFEAAIDSSYTHKSSHRGDTESIAPYSRRSSMMLTGNQPRYPQDNHYGGRPMSYRAESSHYGPATPGQFGGYMAPGASRSGYFDGPGGYGGSSYGPAPMRPGPSRDRSSRMHSEPPYQGYGREQNVYPLPHKDRSYETVTSAAASGNSDPAGYQTDPTSSDNSSIRRKSPAKRQEPVNDYGIGFSQSQSYQQPNFSVGYAGGSGSNHPLPPPPQGYLQPAAGAPSPVPRKQPSVLRRQPAQQRPEMPEKRKSWFSRRFSKNG